MGTRKTILIFSGTVYVNKRKVMITCIMLRLALEV